MYDVRIFKDQRGDTLMSVMIAAGLMAVVALSGMEMIAKSFESTRGIEQRLGVSNLTQEVSGLLRDPAACRSTFGNVDLQTELPRSYTVIRDKAGNPVFQTQQNYENDRVRLRSITLKDHVTESSSDGRAKLELIFDKVGNSPGPREFVRNMVVKTTRVPSGANPNQLDSCSAYAAEGDESIWQQLANGDIYYSNGDTKVGIGVESPESALHILTHPEHNSQLRIGVNDTSTGVSSSGTLSYAPIVSPVGGSTPPKGLLMSDGSFWSGSLSQWIANSTSTSHIVLSQGTIGFDTSSTTVGSSDPHVRRMTITADGNVGIGTVSPSAKLEVNGGGIVVNGSKPFFLLTNHADSGMDMLTGVAPNNYAGVDDSFVLGMTQTDALRMMIHSDAAGSVSGVIKRGNRFMVGNLASPLGIESFTGMDVDSGSVRFRFANDEFFRTEPGSTIISNAGTQAGKIKFVRGRLSGNVKTAVQTGDYLGKLRFTGFLGNMNSNAGVAAEISSMVDSGSVNAASVPGRLDFWTKPNGGVMVERMTIRSDGNVGIGTTSPDSLLHVAGSAKVGRLGSFPQLTVSGGSILLESPSGPNKWIRTSGDSLQIRDGANSQTLLDISDTGNMVVMGNLTTSSDRRLKTKIVDLDSEEFIHRLFEIRPVQYVWKDPKRDSRVQYGFIAQEVEKIFPELVTTAPDKLKTKSVNYIGFIAPILAVLKSYKEKIDDLFSRQEVLRKELVELKHQQDELESQSQPLMEKLIELENRLTSKQGSGNQVSAH